MKWSYWISLYVRTHCVARGLRPLTLAAYEDALRQFSEWVRVTHSARAAARGSGGHQCKGGAVIGLTLALQ